MTNTPGDRRRRFAKACDSCRRKKLRCDGVRPLCARCQDANTPCHYTDVHKPESRQRRGRDSTRTPRRLDDEQDAGPSIATASPTVPRAHAPGIEASSGLDGALSARTDNAEPVTPAREEDRQILSSDARLPDQPGNPRPNDCAGDPDTIVGRNVDTRYFGPASGISLVSVRTNSRESDAPKRHAAQHRFQEGSWSAWTHPSVQGMLEKRVSRPLPSWTEAFSLVSEFFNYEHQAFPCFHPPTFMTLLGQQYSGTPSDNPAWWASLNAVLAISQRRRLESGRCDTSTSGDELVWGYAANALGTMLDILMRNTQLISVQALLCTAWFFLGTPNPQPSFMLTGSAVRLAHSIGLHKSDHGSSLGAIEQEMRTKVFWIALSLDRELCLRTGRPPAHDLHHFHVDLPPDSVHDDSEVMTTSDGTKLRLARFQAQLCVIQDHIYDELYSSRSSNETTRITGSGVRLTSQLEEWCASVSGFHAHQSVPGGEHHGLIRLYYSYYNCVVLVHRPLARQYWLSLSPATISDLPPSIKASIGQCLTAARSIIRILEAVPYQQKSFYWDVVPIILSAIVILSTNLRTYHPMQQEMTWKQYPRS